MIFRFVVRHCHALARIPLAPHIFDAGLLAWNAFFEKGKLRAIEAVQERALRLQGVQICNHRFGGTGFKRGDLEFAHVHGNGLLDVQLTRERAEELIAIGRALPHHVFGCSCWVSFWIHSESDVDGAVKLLAMACE